MNARKLVVPEELLAGPFTRESALRAGLSRSALENPAILRVAPRACLARAVPSLLDRVNAHALTLPDDVLVEGITALHLYGVGIGDIAVLRFCSARGRDIRRRGVRGRRVRTAPPHRRRIVTPIGGLSTALPTCPSWSWWRRGTGCFDSGGSR